MITDSEMLETSELETFAMLGIEQPKPKRALLSSQHGAINSFPSTTGKSIYGPSPFNAFN